jgi:hypothetical protein
VTKLLRFPTTPRVLFADGAYATWPERGARHSVRRNWRGLTIVSGGIALALVLAAIIASAGPERAMLVLILSSGVTAIALYPAFGAYLLIAITPLVAGINRGAAIPLLRPHEALLLIVAIALGVRLALTVKRAAWPRLRLSRLDISILLVAVTSSVVPLVWMALRGRPIEHDDILYSLIVWKYYGVFLIFRAAVRSVAEARVCLWLAMISAVIVATLAILQSQGGVGVAAFLSRHYAPYGNVTAVTNNRGGSTLGLPIAVADLMALNLGVAVGLLRCQSRVRPLLFGMAFLFVVGVFSAGEFSGLIGLLLGALAIVLVTRRLRYLGVLAAPIAVGAVALRPVIERRLQGFQSVSGLPASWEGRLHNLENYFWPQLFSGDNWLLGVRPAARVVTQKMATGYIWIESGYTWLLWAGGIPLLGAFFYFLWTAGREALSVARARADAVGAAALAVVTGLSVIGVLMIIDPHLTYRGSADLLFALLGITAAAKAMPTRELRAP